MQATVARTPEMGARAIVHAALYGTKGEVHGRFFATCRVDEESGFVISKDGKVVQDRLWVSSLLFLNHESRRGYQMGD